MTDYYIYNNPNWGLSNPVRTFIFKKKNSTIAKMIYDINFPTKYPIGHEWNMNTTNKEFIKKLELSDIVIMKLQGIIPAEIKIDT